MTPSMTMKRALALGLLLGMCQAGAEVVTGSLPERWNEGMADCSRATEAPLQVHAYEPQTFILRQSLCANYEGNFIYVLIGAEKALLIDTGAGTDPEQMPLASTVLNLLPGEGQHKLPLLVVHTHGHLDHRAGDAQFEGMPFVKMVAPELAAVQAFFRFDRWPDGVARLDLGGRIVEVVPAPGHDPTHLIFYDDRTQLLFTGDFLLPGRLIIDDVSQFKLSALRSIEFIRTRPIRHILGAHIELDADGELFPFKSQYHPNERPLELTREDLLKLPAVLEQFNGFYSRHSSFVLSSPTNNLLALTGAAVAVLILIVWGLRRFLRRRRTRLQAGATA